MFKIVGRSNVIDDEDNKFIDDWHVEYKKYLSLNKNQTKVSSWYNWLTNLINRDRKLQLLSNFLWYLTVACLECSSNGVP